MALPKVAIVGRPNVGKSSVFNWLAGRPIAIVEPTAGVTRDRLTAPIRVDDHEVEIIDTGGMGIEDADDLTADVERQIRVALEEADLLLFVVDVQTGLLPLDEFAAQRLRRIGKPILVVANKADSPDFDLDAQEFVRLGWPDVVTVSVLHNRYRDRILDWIAREIEQLQLAETTEPEPIELKLALVGRRNTGKSTFINWLAQEPRVIVSEVPGTTRDSVDVRFECDGKKFIAIDTAGVRRKSSIANSIEFYSVARAERSIRRADVVLLFFDAQQPISKVDKQLADYILKHYKPAIFVVNKWDLMRPRPTGEWAEYLRQTFPNLDYVPIAFVTAKTGKNIKAVLNLAQHLHKQAGMRVNTGRLNRILREAIERQAPPLRMNRVPRIYFGTQVATHPPTIVLFTNDPALIDSTYRRYLVKYLRDRLPYAEVPIQLDLRRHRESRREPGPEGGIDTVESAAKVSSPGSESPRSRRPRRATTPEPWRDV